MRKIISTIFCIAAVTSATSAQADWSFNAGYHNPPDATYGGNFMYLWTNWAFELGVGYIGKTEVINTDSKKSNANNAYYTLGGDLNMKYLFRSGNVFRPYFVGGIDLGLSTSSGGQVSAGASVTHPFGGGGFYLMGHSLYLYLGILVINAWESQAGIGINF
jgi:hypothetical protein